MDVLVEKPARPSPDQLSAIKALIDEINRTDGTNYEYTGDDDFRRPGDINDFLMYREGNLVAAGVMFSSGLAEAELTAYTRAGERRRGHFASLLTHVKAELQRRSTPSLLLVVDKESSTGATAARWAGAAYEYTEYAMTRPPGTPLPDADPTVTLRRAGDADKDVLRQVSWESFGKESEGVDLIMGSDTRTVYAIDAEGKTIGMIAVLRENQADYIHGFCVSPKFRHRGYGKAALQSLVTSLANVDPTRTMKLDVETGNKNALGLYQASGFEATAAFDYWRLAVWPAPDS